MRERDAVACGVEVDHYLTHARTERALLDKGVSDWGRVRYVERR